MKTLIHQAGQWLRRRMHRLAVRCSHRLNSLPRRRQRQAVIVFLVCCAGYAALGICGVLHPAARTVEVTPIRVPKPAGETVAHTSTPAASLGKAVRGISSFRRYLDSLKTDSNGLRKLDSLHAARPGLFDTVDQLERIYQLK